MKAAQRITYGQEGNPQNLIIEPGEEIPNAILSEIPNKLILEKLAVDDPGDLSREQLMILAGVGPYGNGSFLPPPSEMDGDAIREALGNFRVKQDLVDWMQIIRPNFDGLDKHGQDRLEMEDIIVAELTGELDAADDEVEEEE